MSMRRSVFCALLAAVALSRSQRVCVVGGGMAGASAAYWLRQLAKENGADAELAIDVVEEKTRPGGRALAEKLLGNEHPIEIGASMLIKQNEMLLNLTRELGLEAVFAKEAAEASGGTLMAIWDGKTFRFVESSLSPTLTALKMAWRYGPLRLKGLIAWAQGFIDKFGTVYSLQQQGVAFRSAEAFWRALGLWEDADASCAGELERVEVGTAKDALVDELAGGLVRNTYNQEVSSAAALMCRTGLAPLAAGGSAAAWSVRGGNHLLAQKMIEASGASVTWHRTVYSLETVTARPSRVVGPSWMRYRVHAKGDPTEPDVEDTETYDVVILAMPRVQSGNGSAVELRGPGVEGTPRQLSTRRFQKVHATFVRGELSSAAFGGELSPAALNGLRDILTPGSSTTLFTSIGRVGSAGGVPIWKFFSKGELTDHYLSTLFAQPAQLEPADVVRYEWFAYPQYPPGEAAARARAAPTVIMPGLFDAGAIEYAGTSAMEVAALSGRNAALLAAEHLGIVETSKHEPHSNARPAARATSRQASFDL